MGIKKSDLNQQCLICGDGTDSMHFGAFSCRACSMFFKRQVIGKKRLERRCNRECSLNSAQRKLCTSCRFDKCLKVGMKESAVLNRMASTTPKLPKNVPCTSEQSTSQTNNGSFLRKLQEGYETLERARNYTFHDNKTHIPVMCNYNSMNDMIVMDVRLIVDNIVPIFDRNTNLPNDQKKLLFYRFLVPFLLLEIGVKSINNDILTMANGDYICYSEIDRYYKSSEGKNAGADAKATEVFRPYWKFYLHTLKSQLDDTQLDRTEFLALASLIFWDFGLNEQTEECTELCRSMRSQVISELSEYEKGKFFEAEHPFRVGQIVMLLQAIQRCIHMIHETAEVSQVYDVYERHFSFFDTVTKTNVI